jgi:protein-export membrane protein SecD
MRRGLRWRLLIIIALLGLSFWQLSYTVKLGRLTPEQKSGMTKEELAQLNKKALHLGLDLQGGMYLMLEVDKSKLSPEEAKDAADRALEVLRNRIDQFGVFEPTIFKQGNDRIMIQLPGVLERGRAKDIIGRTALLEFRLVEDPMKTQRVFEAIDKIAMKAEGLSVTDTLDYSGRPLLSLISRSRSDFVVDEANKSTLEKYLSLPDAVKEIPQDDEFLWGQETVVEGQKFRPVFLVKKNAEMTGSAIVDAQVGIGTADNPNAVRVDLTMTKDARAKWAATTGGNVGRRLAIILDKVVQSAPVIRERIASGRSQIEMGSSPLEEAKDLAVVLRAGALPAPVHVIEERSVGPTLGADSIRSGIRSVVFGGVIVMIFMAIYYSLSGFVADFALVLNLIILLAAMSAFRATLTLPGIAGVVLTLGMAVDANVLIYERMREEIRAGKTVRASIENGYSRAFVTIFDSNLTTVLSAIVLWIFGKGPVRGFAVTLTAGIAISFFTALFVTRVIFDLATQRRQPKRLLI